MGESAPICRPRGDKEEGQDGEQAVKKDFTRQEYHVVAMAYLLKDNTIDRPTESCREGEQVAQRMDVQQHTSVEHHKGHTQQSHERTGK